MTIDYEEIANDQARLEDTAKASIAILSRLYTQRAHFVFELLQNAEDALRRRSRDWSGSRTVTFELSERCFRVRHFGESFNKEDVRAICSVGETTKELTDIGRFGIGFKSVYAVTDRPEVHSGPEHFAIEGGIRPVLADPLPLEDAETLIVIPLKEEDDSLEPEIAAGLERLGASALLFLREIEEIRWSVEGGSSGLYWREAEDLEAGIRRVTVMGQELGTSEVDEEWLVFSRPVTDDDGRDAGYVEIAFASAREQKAGRRSIEPVNASRLVVFFPTVVETHLGFLAQGPYRTTPARDNVPPDDLWNKHLVDVTGSLLLEALCWLRDHDLLDTKALQCLPLNPTDFGETNMFAPLFETTKRALLSESLLPRFDAGHTPGSRARLARTQELRELFSPMQLSALFGETVELPWLSGDITEDRTPELRRYLMQELSIPEVTPETVIPRLDGPFLQEQPDTWLLNLYEFLSGQSALRRRLSESPLIRLEDGTHVVAFLDGQPQAFLPGETKTGFPTVRASVCATETARELLQSLGLTEPDLVDDVVRNVLGAYGEDVTDVGDAGYEADTRRILTAFATDSQEKREKLLSALREAAFVRTIDAGNGSKRTSKPGEVYLATERLKELFAGVAGVLLVDDSCACLRGEDVRSLLEACGAARSLRPVPVRPVFTSEELREMRVTAGCESISTEEPIEDRTLLGLDRLLAYLQHLDPESQREKARLLWESLGELEDRRRSGVFSGTYTWYYYHRRSATFDAAFVRRLNEAAWIPDGNGDLHRPELILFDDLGWKSNPFLQSKIHFRPPVIDRLAEEAGIEPDVLHLLKELGLTSAAELRNKLGIAEEEAPSAEEADGPAGVDEAVEALLGDSPGPTAPVSDPMGSEPSGSGGQSRGGPVGLGTGSQRGDGTPGAGSSRTDGGSRASSSRDHRRTPGSAGGRPFTSYVGAHPDEEEPDPDGLDQQTRMALEETAIDLILQSESQLRRTPPNNPGFDLFEPGDDGQPKLWIEVKAMTGGLHDRPVGLSRTQFECAQEHGEAYWLYVVEHASDDTAHIVRIQDPAGKARTFTFDHGWLAVAEVAEGREDRED